MHRAQVTTLRQQTAANVMDLCWHRFNEDLLAAGDFLWDIRTQVSCQDILGVRVCVFGVTEALSLLYSKSNALLCSARKLSVLLCVSKGCVLHVIVVVSQALTCTILYSKLRV